MKNERAIIGGLLILQFVLVLGFVFHRAPRFAGSLPGSLLGIAGALLLVVPPLVYAAVKRIEFVKQRVTAHVSLATLLSWHVYTGIVGPILAILHTGHRFESNLGIWLTVLMLLTVLSGFVGRYFLGYASMELRDKQVLLHQLATEYNQLIGALAGPRQAEYATVAAQSVGRRAWDSLVGVSEAAVDAGASLPRRAARLAESIADVEYAIRTHEVLKRRAGGWLLAHIVTSCAFYFLLLHHVWAAIYFGLRWFS
jgi:hypothetical protein